MSDSARAISAGALTGSKVAILAQVRRHPLVVGHAATEGDLRISLKRPKYRMVQGRAEGAARDSSVSQRCTENEAEQLTRVRE